MFADTGPFASRAAGLLATSSNLAAFQWLFSIESLPTKLLTNIGKNYACPRLLCHTVLHACRALAAALFDFPFRISNPTITRSVSDKSPMILQIGTGRLRTSVGMASI